MFFVRDRIEFWTSFCRVGGKFNEFLDTTKPWERSTRVKSITRKAMMPVRVSHVLNKISNFIVDHEHSSTHETC